MPLQPLRAPLECSGVSAGGAGGNKNAEVDAYDLADAEDILSKFPESWCDKVLQLAKWQEKVEALQLLVKAATAAPRMVPSNNMYAVVSLIKKLLNEQNVNLLQPAIKVFIFLNNSFMDTDTGYFFFFKLILNVLFYSIKIITIIMINRSLLCLPEDCVRALPHQRRTLLHFYLLVLRTRRVL